MSHKNVLFSLVSALCVGGFVNAAISAPTVKKLGVSNNHIQSGNSTTQKLLNSSVGSTQSRAASLRLGTTGVKPVTVNKATIKAPTQPSDDVVDANRLSVGKYIHTAGVNTGYIKQASASAEAKAQTEDIINLLDRVGTLETQIDTKQPILSSGTGLEIDDNEISISDEMLQQIQLIGQINLDKYYDKNQVDALLESISTNISNINNNVQNVQENSNQVYDNSSNNYTSVSVIDEFPADTFDWDLVEDTNNDSNNSDLGNQG